MVAISTLAPVSRPSLRLVPPRARRPRYGLRRLVVAALCTLAVCAVALLADAAIGVFDTDAVRWSGPSAAAPSEVGRVHVVRPGDTLWSIAADVAPDADPRKVVDQLIAHNGSASIRIGQEVVLP